VVSNGSLGGSGTIAGPVLVTSGGALTPGNSIGTLTVNNTVTLQGTCTMELDRNAFPNADLLIANSIVAGGTLNVVNIGDALQTDDTFDLFDGPISGSFAATNLPALSGGLAWDTGQLGVNGTIKVVGTPLPPPTNITYSVSGNQLVLTWPNGQGWKLQAQTNAVAIGLSTNWVEVMGATSPLTNVINPANGSVFYRLKYP
jgi:hypothetical protein